MKTLRVTVEGKVYHVLVEILDEGHATAAPAQHAAPARSTLSPLPATVEAAPPAAAPAPRATAGTGAAGEVKSPLAGRVIAIDVKPGQTVAEGAQLLTIEAMKMNTYIYAPSAGRVTEIFINAGDAADEGQPLLRIE